MSIPFFYISEYHTGQTKIVLDEDTSRHIIQVLRMMDGEKVNLTDGNGNVLATEITDAHKKHCSVEVKDFQFTPRSARYITIAISLMKNSSRFEWFLEKATEIGVTEIIPMICDRTEKEKFRFERMKAILISAMLQSQQCWLPVLHEPKQLNNQTIGQFNHHQKFIAHCDKGDKLPLQDQAIRQSVIILIGPEGDFTPAEIELAQQNHFIPASLGTTRLRSETAGIVAAVLLQRT